jgi:NADH:ubiquinone reductase (H+-translocating)
MAVVGKGFAILESGRVRLSGFLPWLAWAAVDLQFVGQNNLPSGVLLQWVWSYVTAQRGSRLIVNHRPPADRAARDASPAPEHQPAGVR